MNPTELVQKYFQAMQAGASAGEELFALFADDAVYVEPFSGSEQTHTGRTEIEACFRAGWTQRPPDMTLEVNRIDVDGPTVRTEWTCTAEAFGGAMRGLDVCTVTNGKIERLVVTLS